MNMAHTRGGGGGGGVPLQPGSRRWAKRAARRRTGTLLGAAARPGSEHHNLLALSHMLRLTQPNLLHPSLVRSHRRPPPPPPPPHPPTHTHQVLLVGVNKHTRPSQVLVRQLLEQLLPQDADACAAPRSGRRGRPWGVGRQQAEASMLGPPLPLRLPAQLLHPASLRRHPNPPNPRTGPCCRPRRSQRAWRRSRQPSWAAGWPGVGGGV